MISFKTKVSLLPLDLSGGGWIWIWSICLIFKLQFELAVEREELRRKVYFDERTFAPVFFRHAKVGRHFEYDCNLCGIVGLVGEQKLYEHMEEQSHITKIYFSEFNVHKQIVARLSDGDHFQFLQRKFEWVFFWRILKFLRWSIWFSSFQNARKPRN